jgi:hypothetical protein
MIKAYQTRHDLSWMIIQKDLVLSILNCPKVTSWGNGIFKNRPWHDLDDHKKADLLFVHFSRNGTLAEARTLINQISDGQIGNTYIFNDVSYNDEREAVRELLNSSRGHIIREFFLSRL